MPSSKAWRLGVSKSWPPPKDEVIAVAYAAGVDVGSTQTKAVIIDEDRSIVGRSLLPTGANVIKAAEDSYFDALQRANIDEEEVDYVVGTGYGRYRVTFGNTQVTEISCHGRGAVHLFPNTNTVIDMGGQDTKAIAVNPQGEIVDFCMNDKCAAGTGRFLQAAAVALDIPLDELGPLSLQGDKPVKISTTCTVFAESEVLAWIGKGKKIEDVLYGVHQSIATRSVGLLRRVGINPEITFTGGVSKNEGMVKALEDRLETSLNISEESHYMGALGAALFAHDHVIAGRAPADTGAEVGS
jgi:(R)-2-hydroxyacyl-CoA dehydratese activating ATPase